MHQPHFQILAILVLLLLPACVEIESGNLPGPDRYYKRLAQNRGKWTATNIHFHQEDTAWGLFADTLFTGSYAILFEVDENNSTNPLAVQLSVPAVVWANGQPFVLLNRESVSGREYVGDGRNGSVYLDRGGFRSLKLDWKSSTHFVGKLSSGDDLHYTLFDAFTQ